MAAVELSSGISLIQKYVLARLKSSLARKLGIVPESNGWYQCVLSPTFQYLPLCLPFGSYLQLPAALCANTGLKLQSWELRSLGTFHSSALGLTEG